LDQARSDVSLLLTELASRDPVTGAVVAVVETPRASRNKFNYDPEIGAFRLKRVLPLGSTFPYDFGFIPSTRAEDGDPLDVLLLVDEPAPVGCVVHVRLLGVIEAEQRELDGRRVRNDRLIAAGATPISTRISEASVSVRSGCSMRSRHSSSITTGSAARNSDHCAVAGHGGRQLS
jgi:hypothetical protein